MSLHVNPSSRTSRARIIADLRLTGARSASPSITPRHDSSEVTVQFAGTWDSSTRDIVLRAIGFVEDNFSDLLPQDDPRWVIVRSRTPKGFHVVGHRVGISAVFEHTDVDNLSRAIRQHFASRLKA